MGPACGVEDRLAGELAAGVKGKKIATEGAQEESRRSPWGYARDLPSG